MTRKKQPKPVLPTEAQLARERTMPQRVCLFVSRSFDQYVRNHYLTGDGEVVQPQRPGSEQAMAIPSRGFRT